jgi:hypothetical protein
LERGDEVGLDRVADRATAGLHELRGALLGA